MRALPHVTLRRAGAGDRAFAYQVRKAAFEPCESQLRPWAEDEQRQRHDRRFDDYTYRIVQVEGLDVGVLVTDASVNGVKVLQLFVLTDHQAKGVGEACMRIVSGEALGLPVRLRVLKVNPRALVFFSRLAFTRIGETATHVLLERASHAKPGAPSGSRKP